jgi:hypothetical protein
MVTPLYPQRTPEEQIPQEEERHRRGMGEGGRYTRAKGVGWLAVGDHSFYISLGGNIYGG